MVGKPVKAGKLLLALAGLLFAAAASAQSGEALLEAKGCLGCHGLEEKKMGPALREAAAKHKGAPAKLIAALREG
jgi:cytochrome c